jgi:hypothetical protein
VKYSTHNFSRGTLSHHYHFIALIPETPTLRKLISHPYTLTVTKASGENREEPSQGRNILFSRRGERMVSKMLCQRVLLTPEVTMSSHAGVRKANRL